MYSGDVPAILSARKTYSFRGIELPLAVRLASASHVDPPMSALVPLFVYVITPRRRRRGLLCFFLFPHSMWNISTQPGISHVLRCVSSRERERGNYLLYLKSNHSALFLCNPLCQIIKQDPEKYHGIRISNSKVFLSPL